MAIGVPGRLRTRIISTFGTTRMVGCQPNAPAAFTPREIPSTYFQKLSRPQGTWFCRKEPRKKSQVTTPLIDSGTVRLVAQRLNHYATPSPRFLYLYTYNEGHKTPSALFWDITQCRLVFPHRTFGTTSRPHLQTSRDPRFSWPRFCPETSIRNYHPTLRNIPEEHRSHIHRGGSQKSRHKMSSKPQNLYPRCYKKMLPTVSLFQVCQSCTGI